MKKYPLVVCLFFLIHHSASADGFRCVGDSFRVKFYDETTPALGTRTPAVLVISSEEDGTMMVVSHPALSLARSGDRLIFSGAVSRGPVLMSAAVSIPGSARVQGKFEEHFRGTLKVTGDDGYVVSAELECSKYLKRSL